MTLTRFQLVFEGGPQGHQTEFRENSLQDEPHIDGRLIVDDRTYVIRGIEWIVRRADDGGETPRFVCTFVAEVAEP